MSVEVKAQNTTTLASVKAIYDAAEQANDLLDNMQAAATAAGTTLNGIYQDAADAQAAANQATQDAATAGRAANIAQTAAEAAKAAADEKKRVFTTEPVPPYDVGDLWAKLGEDLQDLVDDSDNNLITDQSILIQAAILTDAAVYVCVTPKLEGQAFSDDDWSLATADTSLREWFWHDALGAHILGDVTGFRNDLDSTGMHIIDTNTETSVAEFTANNARIGKATSGNMQVDVDSVDIKDGNTVLATFGADGAQIGIDGSGRLNLDSESLAFYNKNNDRTFAVVNAQADTTKTIHEYSGINYIRSGTITYKLKNSYVSGLVAWLYFGTGSGSVNYEIPLASFGSWQVDYTSDFGFAAEGTIAFDSDTSTVTLTVTRMTGSTAWSFEELFLEFTGYPYLSTLAIGEYADISDINTAIALGYNESRENDNAFEVSRLGDVYGRDFHAIGDITAGDHDSPIGTVLTGAWTAGSSSASGTNCTATITLTRGTWMLGMLTPTCSASMAYSFTNISSANGYPYFNFSTGQSGWFPIEVNSSSVTTRVATAGSASVTFTNTGRGKIMAVRIA